MIPKPTAAEIKNYRGGRQCGMFEARRVLFKEWREKELYRIRMQAGELYTVEACQTVIVQLLDFLTELEKDNAERN